MGGLVIVTGMAGAGRTTTLHALEDIGYEAVDNLPLTLLTSIADASAQAPHLLAVGVDSRSRHFDPATVLRTLDDLRARPGPVTELLFLDCDDEVLRRRFTETRRRHPLADRPVLDAISREREMMQQVREAADTVLDTSRFSVHDLRREIGRRFGQHGDDTIRLSVVSFSFREGLPREADLVFDVRFLKNPHWQLHLRPKTGLDPEVARFVSDDPNTAVLLERLQALLEPLIPAYREEGKRYLTIAIGCTGGKHRSVFVSERLAIWLAAQGWDVAVRHRELGLPDAAAGSRQPLEESR